MIADLLGWSRRFSLRPAGDGAAKIAREVNLQKEHSSPTGAAPASDSLSLVVIDSENGNGIVGRLLYRLEKSTDNHQDKVTARIEIGASIRGTGEAEKVLREGDARCFAAFPTLSLIEGVVSPEALPRRKCSFGRDTASRIVCEVIMGVISPCIKRTSTMSEEKVFVVAELSADHGHKLDTALAAVRGAKASGADAIKIQTYTPDTITLDCDNEYFQIAQGTIWDGTTLHKLYQEAYTPWEWHGAIRDEAHACGLVFFSTPFDFTAVDFLESLVTPIYKIASFEINDVPLIEYAASKGKPMILSTGVATLAEIEEAVAACRRVRNDDVTLLKCTSSYPAPVERANLLTIPDMARRFGVRVGISDHTMGSVVAVGAVALGAQVVEKHFTLDRAIGGPDASFSMNPDEFSSMVREIRDMEKARGHVEYELDERAKADSYFKRSLFVSEDIKAGNFSQMRTFARFDLQSAFPPHGSGTSLARGQRGIYRRAPPFQIL